MAEKIPNDSSNLSFSFNKPPIAPRPNNPPKDIVMLNQEEGSSSGTSRNALANPYRKRTTSRLTVDQAIEYELKSGRTIDPNVDKQKLRKTVSNRLSARRTLKHQLEYKKDLEDQVKKLQETISELSRQKISCEKSQDNLKVENTKLQQQIKCCMEKSELCKVQHQENEIEVQRLREICAYQMQKKHNSSIEEEMPATTCNQYDLDQNPPATENNIDDDDDDIDQYLNLDALINLN